DHPRPRRHRRPAAWPSGGAVLSRLLRLLMLSAAVHLLRPASSGGQAAARQHRRIRRRGRGDRAHRPSDPRPLARGAHSVARRFGVCPRGCDELVQANGVNYLFGLAKNARLVAEMASALATAEADGKATGQAARRFKEFSWSTRDSWSRQRRVIAKAEWTGGGANPRFVVTSVSSEDTAPQRLYEEIYCA